MPIVDGMLALAAEPFHRLHQLPGVPDGDRLGTDPRFHCFPDQPRRHRVGVTFHPNRAAAAHPDLGPLPRLQPPLRQWSQLGQFLRQPLPAPGVALGDQRTQELHVFRATGKIPAATQQQRLLHGLLEAAVTLLTIAVLVAARRVGGLGLDTVVTQQRLVFRRVLLRIPFVVHRQGHAISPVPSGHTVQLPQSVLQTLAEAGETLRQAHRHVFPVRIGQDQVVHQMRERLPLNRHSQGVHMGEIRGGQPPRLMHLVKEYFAIGAVLRFPLPDPPFQGATAPLPVLRRLFALQPFQQGFGLQAWLALQPFFEARPDAGERIRARPPRTGRGHLAGQLTEVAILACGLGIHTSFHRCREQRPSLVEALA
jgi:hypothetical protein